MTDHDDLAYTPTDGEDFERELAAIGTHNAVCCQIHNLGHQMFEGTPSLSPKVALIFELDEKLKTGQKAGQPMVINRTFAYFMGATSALRQFLEAWRGRKFTEEEIKTFTLRKLIGAPCSLVVIHKLNRSNKMKAYVAGISKKPPEVPALPVTYTETPKWITDDKAKAVAPPARKAPASGSTGSTPTPEDDLPF